MARVVCGGEARVHFAQAKCAQQRNGCDCGVYLLKFAHILGLGKCCEGAVKAVGNLKPEDVSNFRTFVRKTIISAAEKRKKKMNAHTKTK